VVTSELLLDSDAGNGAAHIEMARRIGSDIFKAGDRAASGGLTRDVIAAAAK